MSIIDSSNKGVAVITGASSGIGKDMAKTLSEKGYEIILVARNETRLNEVSATLPNKSHIITADLSDTNECLELYRKICSISNNVKILINNAGFGLFGEFNTSNINTEISMINTNITALHVLTKLFLNDFTQKNDGYILNVASSAAFMPGPLMSTYYSTKAYVLRLTESIAQELKNKKSNVYIGALCPGPVDTNFNETANVNFAIRGLKSDYVAKYGIDKMFKRKVVIIPGISMKLGKFGLRLLPDSMQSKISYKIQKQKS